MTFPGMASTSVPNSASSVYPNNSSGAGMASSVDSQAPAEMSPADSVITAYGSVIQLLQQLSEKYPGIADSETQAATQAIYAVLEKVAGSLNSGGSPASSGGLGASSGSY